jgi:hypothetical protein
MPESRPDGSNKRLLAAAVILLGVALLGGAGYRDRDMLRLETVGARVQGTVVAVEARSTPKGGTVYRPVVRFMPANGSGATQFEDGDGTNPASYHVGDAVQVLYVGGPAATAVIDRGLWNWRRAFIVGCAGVLCLALGLSMLRRLSPRDDWLMPPTAMSAIPAPPAMSATPTMSVPPTMSAPPAAANLVAATHVTAAPAVAAGVTTVSEPWLTRLHYKRWVVALFVVDAALMFALTANKTGPTSFTGYTAFGAILFTLVCALAMFSAFTAAVAHVLFIVLGITGVIEEGAAAPAGRALENRDGDVGRQYCDAGERFRYAGDQRLDGCPDTACSGTNGRQCADHRCARLFALERRQADGLVRQLTGYQRAAAGDLEQFT